MLLRALPQRLGSRERERQYRSMGMLGIAYAKRSLKGATRGSESGNLSAPDLNSLAPARLAPLGLPSAVQLGLPQTSFQVCLRGSSGRFSAFRFLISTFQFQIFLPLPTSQLPQNISTSFVSHETLNSCSFLSIRLQLFRTPEPLAQPCDKQEHQQNKAWPGEQPPPARGGSMQIAAGYSKGFRHT